MKASTIAAGFVLSGIAGWTIENVKRGPTFSKAFNGAKVPFLPVYAVGGAAVLLLLPTVAPLPIWQRFIIYGAVATAVEATAGFVDRLDGDIPSWDYDGSIVDLRYSALWAVGALLVEQLALIVASKEG